MPLEFDPGGRDLSRIFRLCSLFLVSLCRDLCCIIILLDSVALGFGVGASMLFLMLRSSFFFLTFMARAIRSLMKNDSEVPIYVSCMSCILLYEFRTVLRNLSAVSVIIMLFGV